MKCPLKGDRFKVGDIVGLNEFYAGGVETPYKKRFRGRIEKILNNDFDMNGERIVRLRRLDTTKHKTERWSQGWLVLKEGEL